MLHCNIIHIVLDMKKFVLLFLPPFLLLYPQPFQHRILIATSTDGLNFVRQNIIAVDSGDVPDAVVGPDSEVYLYFQGLWTHTTDGIMLGKSPDGFNNWQFYQVHIPGTESWPGKPCDPDIILRNDTFRLYFTGDPYNDRQPETYSAISLDGINFTLESGVRFAVSKSAVLDPSLLWTGDTLQYFAGGAPPFYNWHAHSYDGINFIQQPNYFAESLMLANGIKLANGYRFFGFRNLPPCGIRSLYSPDGENWTVEPGYRLKLDTTSRLESLIVKDPAVVYKDSIFIMYYVTRKPLSGIEENGLLKDDKIDLEIFPNPCRNGLGIGLNSGYIRGKKGLFRISIKIFDITGSPVRKWENILVSEREKIFWYGDNELGVPVNPGIYFVCFEDNLIRKRIKVILIE
ncbi:MAG: hypothetical protein ABIK39_00405 [candidate division WOR-3 bacterium]